VPQLGRDHDGVAVGEVLQRPAGDLLAGALGVQVGRVEEGDAGLDAGDVLLLMSCLWRADGDAQARRLFALAVDGFRPVS
jgi:hypothetical protein